MIIMFGGLHLEKRLLGDLLASSGWTDALTDAAIATVGTADSFLKCTHVTRTRHAHQLTALALSVLQKNAYDSIRGDLSLEEPFEEWRSKMIKKSPAFLYWDLILKIGVLVLVFIRAHREKNFPLYVEAHDALMFMFFTVDHYNYSRWVSVHIREMKSLPEDIKEDFMKNWVVQKICRRFSTIPLDQTHEQENAKGKGKGGVVGLTENPSALQRWLVAGPQMARLLTEFESTFLLEDDSEHNYEHHEEGLFTQEAFRKQASKLTDVITDYGNPFLDDYPELLVFHTRDCVDDSVVATIRNFETLGKDQYKKFKEVLDKRERSIHDPIKRNSLTLFKTPK